MKKLFDRRSAGTGLRLLASMLTVAALAVSCNKDPGDDLLTRTVDTVIGTYECKSITLVGDPVDLDNDGVSSVDLVKEYSKIWNASIALTSKIRIHPAEAFGSEVYFNMEIPVQCVNYDKISMKYVPPHDVDYLFGKSIVVNFSYSVDPSGAITTNLRNDTYTSSYYDEEYIIRNVILKNAFEKEVTLFKDGRIEVEIKNVLFDYSTGKLITAPVKYVYERISYSY